MAVVKYLVAGSIITYIYIYIGALLCNVRCGSGEVLSGREYHTIYIYIYIYI